MSHEAEVDVMVFIRHDSWFSFMPYVHDIVWQGRDSCLMITTMLYYKSLRALIRAKSDTVPNLKEIQLIKPRTKWTTNQ